MGNLVIYGAGYLGQQYAERFRQSYLPRSRFVGFVDDHKEGNVGDVPILGKREDLARLRQQGIDELVITLFSDPRTRLELFLEAEQLGFSFPSFWQRQESGITVGRGVYIHETAVMLGIGQEFADFSAVSAFTTVEGGVSVGRGAILTPYVFIGYDARIGEGTTFFPRSSCAPQKRIGKNCVIGPHVFVHRDLPDGTRKMRLDNDQESDQQESRCRQD